MWFVVFFLKSVHTLQRKCLSQIRLETREGCKPCRCLRVINGINQLWNKQGAILPPHTRLNYIVISRSSLSGVVSQVQFNPHVRPSRDTTASSGGWVGGGGAEDWGHGKKRITSVSIKTDQYRVTRSRGRGKYPTKSFNTRTTLRQRRQQPLYCQPIALFPNTGVNVERQ